MINVPHLIAYKAPALTAWLVRHISNIKYVNLTNILLDKLIVPELLQEDCNKENILNTLNLLLDKKSDLYKIQEDGFKDLRKTLGVGKIKPSQRASEIILKEIKE